MLNLWRERYLLEMITKNQIDTIYRGSSLGLLWSVITPLVLLAVYSIVFGVIFGGRFGIGPNETSLDYILGIACGVNVFNFFAEATLRAPSTIRGYPNFVKKVKFPLELLPAANIGIAGFHFCLSMALLIVALILLKGLPSAWSLLIPIPVLSLVLMSLGLAYVLSAVGVFLKDLQNAIGIVTTVVMFMSAVFFPIEQVPAGVRPLVALNPLAQIISLIRGTLVFGLKPSFTAMLATLIFSVALWSFGLQYFLSAKRHFADHIHG